MFSFFLSFLSTPRLKQRFSVVVPSHGHPYSTLDILKVADTAIFLVSACQQNGIDSAGENILTSCLAQGLPSTIVAVTDLESLPPKVWLKKSTD
jgi:pre-rRNA-processing protein TSR1